jgi:hypothetical protein
MAMIGFLPSAGEYNDNGMASGCSSMHQCIETGRQMRDPDRKEQSRPQTANDRRQGSCTGEQALPFWQQRPS